MKTIIDTNVIFIISTNKKKETSEMMLKQGWFLKAVLTAAAAAALAAVGLGCGDDGGTSNVTGGGDGIVGDWLFSSYTSDDKTEFPDPDEKMVVSIKSSGDFVAVRFEKLGNVWVESSEGAGSWSVSGSKLYLTEKRNGETDTMNYKVFGNTFTMDACRTYTYEDDGNLITETYCFAQTFTSVNIANFRKSLGTVYTNDSKLYSLAGYNDLLWYSEDDADEFIDFDAGGVYGPGLERYVDSDYSIAYYTNNNKLYFVEKDCEWDEDDVRHCTVSDPIALDYSVKGTGQNTKLTIGGDEWLPADYDEYMNSRWNSPATSTQSKRPSALIRGKGKSKSVFSPSAAQLSALKKAKR